MSKTIWKYKLPRDGQTIVINEQIIKVLHIGTQRGEPTAWIIVDPTAAAARPTEVVAWGTGWDLPDDVYRECNYWGSAEDNCGYIWHYFAATGSSEVQPWDYVTSDKAISGYVNITVDTVPNLGTITYTNTKEGDEYTYTYTALKEVFNKATEGTCYTTTDLTLG